MGFDEITNRVFDADHAQVNGHTERHCDENPTQPRDAELLEKLRLSFRRIEPQGQRGLQHLPTRSPGDAEQQRRAEMQHRAPRQMRPDQRPALREHKDERREKGIQEPVAACSQQLARRNLVPAAEMRLRNPIDGGKRGGHDPRDGHQHPRL